MEKLTVKKDGFVPDTAAYDGDDTLEGFLSKVRVHKITKEPLFTTDNIFKTFLKVNSDDIPPFFWHDGVCVGRKGHEDKVFEKLNEDFSEDYTRNTGNKWNI